MRELTVTVRQQDGATVLTPVGEIDYDARPALAAARARLPDPVGVVLLDMTEVSFMDSTGLHFLIDLRRRVAAGGGRLTLAGIQDQPIRLLRLTGLIDFLTAPPAPRRGC
ncbi:STAS domain-containing protein [Allostreptomyces psammosilenae]|uniref:Anti-sigma factor antagonist n=1 Tax=Allostreptomyces psammosilenae TaxID=1892865 RepID=A0A853A0Z4_9ACTN|nr:STAS domain-containing protein [Allostreptomyces psammosilenae]NYI04481.1 anti-anti-sigma factor [Allostreptomyces psammosilenae]